MSMLTFKGSHNKHLEYNNGSLPAQQFASSC